TTLAAIDDLAVKAAASPRRRRILKLVWDAELSSHQIAKNFADVTWQSVSLNLKVLRDAGLVRERRQGTSRLYKADRDRCGPLESLLRTMWKSDLEQLGSVLEAERNKGHK
ncbi:MAG: ArsR/SmtB family transcription factor, partial [Acidimicrobiia bacterium]